MEDDVASGRSTEPATPDPGKAGKLGPQELRSQLKDRRAKFERQVEVTRADIERQVQATKAQFDATNERIEARVGRNLVNAILIGVAAGGIMLVSLIIFKVIFVVLASAVVAFATLELRKALEHTGRRVPAIPTVISAVAMQPAAFFLHDVWRWSVVLLGILLVIVWRVAEQLIATRRTDLPTLVRDLASGTFIQVYVPFLASFAVYLVAQPDGEWWTLAFLILVICVDVGAYASGLSFGKHKMAPVISPNKTWEGFAGAGVAAVVAGVLLAILMLGVPWWVGVLLGLLLLGSATVGDLAESLIKRDIGVKDMSSWLPGHGGFLDRLDSILPSAVVAYVVYLLFGGLAS